MRNFTFSSSGLASLPDAFQPASSAGVEGDPSRGALRTAADEVLEMPGEAWDWKFGATVAGCFRLVEATGAGEELHSLSLCPDFLEYFQYLELFP